MDLKRLLCCCGKYTYHFSSPNRFLVMSYKMSMHVRSCHFAVSEIKRLGADVMRPPTMTQADHRLPCPSAFRLAPSLPQGSI